MEYYVLFSDGYVQTVPAHWLNIEEKRFYWPPKKVKIISQTMHNLVPDDTWVTHSFIKYLGPFSSLEVSLQVEKSCTSISTSEDSDAIVTAATTSIPSLRKRLPPKSLYSTGSESDEEPSAVKKTKVVVAAAKSKGDEQSGNEEEDFHLSNSDSSPELHQTKSRMTSNLSTAPPEYSDNKMITSSDNVIENELNNDDTSSTQGVSFQKPNEKNGKTSKPIKILDDRIISRTKSPLEVPPTKISKHRDNDVNTNNLRSIENILNTPTLPNKNDQPLTESRYKSIYHTQILSKLNSINNRIGSKKQPSNSKENLDFSLLPNFPLQRYQELDDFDEKLNDAEVAEQFRNFVTNVGGKNEGDFIRCVIREIMTNVVVSSYSWSGQRGTEPIKNKNLVKIIIDTVSNSDKSFNKKSCKEHFHHYVQHAHEGLKERPSNIRRTVSNS